MPKIRIWTNEQYPVYGISVVKPGEIFTCEVSDEFMQEYERIEKEYADMQIELSGLRELDPQST